MTKLQKVEIPEGSRRPKIITDGVSDAVISEILAFIAAGGKTHLCEWHTHTKPTAGSEVVYLGEFEVPDSKRRIESYALCPCCTDCFPKYRFGLIGFFPSERVIRLLGKGCFAHLSPEFHAAAYAKFKQLQQREKQMQYILSKLPLVVDLRRTAQLALPIAIAMDNFRTALQYKLKETIGIQLWNHVKDGALSSHVVKDVVVQTKDGKQKTTTLKSVENYGRIQGYQLLDPARTSIATQVRRAERALESIDFGRDFSKIVPLMNDSERRRTARSLKTGMTTMEDSLHEIKLLRLFLKKETIATLRTWGSSEGCPCPLFVELQGVNFYIGTESQHKVRIELEAAINDRLPLLPHLGKTELVEVDNNRNKSEKE